MQRTGMILLASALALVAPGTWSAGAAFSTDFREGVDFDTVWDLEELEDGEIVLAADPTSPSRKVAFMRTRGRSEDGSVTKAHLVHRFERASEGSTIVMRAKFYFPADSHLDSVILMDLECGSCGLNFNPGVRLYLRDGRLRVDRKKIYIDDALVPHEERQLEPERWYDIEWRTTLGHGGLGHSTVTVDGDVMLDEAGATLLSRGIVEEYLAQSQGIDRERIGLALDEAVDRFQIGITANSNETETSLYLDEVEFRVE